MSGELSRAHRWFPLVALALTLALFAYSLGSPAYLDEVARIETGTLAPASALDGRLSFTLDDAAGYWARQYGIERYLREIAKSETVEIYVAPLPAAIEGLLLGLLGCDLALLRLMQLLLHTLAAVLLFRLTWRYSANGTASLTAGLLFVAHPCHTLAVTTLAGLGPVTAAVFALLALELFERRREKERYTALSAAAYVLACLSDMSMLLLPFLFLWRSLEVQEGGSQQRDEAVRSTRPFFVAALMLAVLRLLLWPSESGFHSIEWWYFLKPFERYSFWLLTLLQTLFYYSAVIPPAPVSLTVVSAGQWGLAALLSLAFLAAVPLLARRCADRAAASGYALFWVAGLGLIGSLSSFEASYLPSLGISMALGALLARLLAALQRRSRALKWLLLLPLLFYIAPSLTHIFEAQAAWRVGGKTAHELAQRLATVHPEPQQGETVYLFNVWPGAWYFDRRVRTLYAREDLRVRLMSVDPFPATDGSPLPQDVFTAKISRIFEAFRGVNELDVRFDGRERIKARMLSGCFFANIMDWSPQFFFSFPPHGEKFEHADFHASASELDERHMPVELEFVLQNPEAPASFFKLEDGEWKSIDRPQP